MVTDVGNNSIYEAQSRWVIEMLPSVSIILPSADDSFS